MNSCHCWQPKIRKQYGQHPLENADYGAHYQRQALPALAGVDGKRHDLRPAGQHDGSRRIEPTVLTGVTLDSPIMQEEIFGPLLTGADLPRDGRYLPDRGGQPHPAGLLFIHDR